MNKGKRRVLVVLLTCSLLVVSACGIGTKELDVTSEESSVTETIDDSPIDKSIGGIINTDSYSLMMEYASNNINNYYQNDSQIASEKVVVNYDESGNISSVVNCSLDNLNNSISKRGLEIYTTYREKSLSDNIDYNTITSIYTYKGNKKALESVLVSILQDEDVINRILGACENIGSTEVSFKYSDGEIKISNEGMLLVNICRDNDILGDNGLDLEKMKVYEPLLDQKAYKSLENYTIKTTFNKDSVIDFENMLGILQKLDYSDNINRELMIERTWTVKNSDDWATKALIAAKEEDIAVLNVRVEQSINDIKSCLLVEDYDRFRRGRKVAFYINIDSDDYTRLLDIGEVIYKLSDSTLNELKKAYEEISSNSEVSVNIHDNCKVSLYKCEGGLEMMYSIN